MTLVRTKWRAGGRSQRWARRSCWRGNFAFHYAALLAPVALVNFLAEGTQPLCCCWACC
ncbi:MAG: hypothetical protein R2838_25925 [Caldilineaceae bacterium]